jgi:hypothetical protein
MGDRAATGRTRGDRMNLLTKCSNRRNSGKFLDDTLSDTDMTTMAKIWPFYLRKGVTVPWYTDPYYTIYKMSA